MAEEKTIEIGAVEPPEFAINLKTNTIYAPKQPGDFSGYMVEDTGNVETFNVWGFSNAGRVLLMRGQLGTCWRLLAKRLGIS